MDKNGSKIKQIPAKKIIEIHNLLIEEFGGEAGVIYEGSIRFIPEWVALKKSIEEAAAVYLFEIITGHPFIDGNKRTGFEACDTFLQLNGFYLQVNAEEGKELTLKIARGEADYKGAVEWIKKRLRKL